MLRARRDKKKTTTTDAVIEPTSILGIELPQPLPRGRIPEALATGGASIQYWALPNVMAQLCSSILNSFLDIIIRVLRIQTPDELSKLRWNATIERFEKRKGTWEMVRTIAQPGEAFSCAVCVCVYLQVGNSVLIFFVY
jgi:hypothetical protein